MMKKYKDVDEIWKWSKKLKGFTEKNNWNLIKDDLLQECFLESKTQLNFINDIVSFPSCVTKEIAEKELQFMDENFSLLDLLNHIHSHMSLLDENNVVNIILLLVDIALYKAYSIIEESSYGDIFSQLNMCIILDTMKNKPENSDNVITILNEVNAKSKISTDKLTIPIIWAIAMLNYKMHVYNEAILFFNIFLNLAEHDHSEKTYKQKIHAQIYIGYCYEKMNEPSGFIKAIEIFEELLNKLEDTNENYNIIVELHHGLGHFYNEKAIFGGSITKDEDISNARMHMRKALDVKADYYSCYGALFHEFGDYENADLIFQEAMEKKEIIDNNELVEEMQFYKGQTSSALADSEDELEKAEERFAEFENYCEKTSNYDGIVHARIFKIRTRLSRMKFIESHNIDKRRENRENIKKWYKELNDYRLSNYASYAIKKEYEKIFYILNVFRILYADDNFMWHMEDILYYLKCFIDLMPKNAGELDFADRKEGLIAGQSSNLYKMNIDNIEVWCAGSEKLARYIANEKLRLEFEANGIYHVNVKPVENLTHAHKRIQGNGKPDMVILIPPTEKDLYFENEVQTIMDVVSESYFLFTENVSDIYNPDWLSRATRGKQQHQFKESIINILSYAYCFRALEILRKELLQPIPLFSLAPTHFSSSYDFQLGEDIEIQLNAFNESKNDKQQKRLRQLLQFVDGKYSSSLLGRKLVRNTIETLETLCCKEEGFFTACFPQPGVGIEQDDNYISYYIKDSAAFENGIFMHEVCNGGIYTIKALPQYKELFWTIELMIGDRAIECDKEEDCTICYETLLTDNSEISECCRKLLAVIFGKEPVNLDYPYKCILRKQVGNEMKRSFIYMILLQN